MKRIDGATIEWRALWETMVIPVPSRRIFQRGAERESIRRFYPFEPAGCRIDRAAAIGAVLVTPPGLSGAAADRPVPALAIAHSTRARKSLATGEAVYRFGTPRGYDYYHFHRRRLVACWSTIGSEPDATSNPDAGTAPAPSIWFSPRALSAARADHRPPKTRRARVVTVALALAAVGVQVMPDSFGTNDSTASLAPAEAVPGPAISGRAATETWSPVPVLSAVNRLIPDLQVRSFSAARNHYRWELQTSQARVNLTSLTETYPEIDISVQHRNNHTTVSLEGTR